MSELPEKQQLKSLRSGFLFKCDFRIGENVCRGRVYESNTFRLTISTTTDYFSSMIERALLCETHNNGIRCWVAIGNHVKPAVDVL